MESYNKSSKSKTVPVFITICGIAIFGSAVLGLSNSFSANIDDTKIVKSNKEVVEINKIEVNRELNELQYAVKYAIDGERDVTKNSGAVLKFDAEKIRFAFMLVSQKGNNNRMIRNVNPEGAGITGYLAVDKEYFIDFYQELFKSGVNEDILADEFEEKDGYLYGSVMSGIMMGTEAYKVNAVYKDGNNYEVVIDVLLVNYEDDKTVDYMADSVIDYPKGEVAYQITLNVTPGDQIYTINSMVA